MSKFEDRQIDCIDCGTNFIWSAAEQDFFDQKGLNSPRRCKPCRAKKRKQFAEREGKTYEHR